MSNPEQENPAVEEQEQEQEQPQINETPGEEATPAADNDDTEGFGSGGAPPNIQDLAEGDWAGKPGSDGSAVPDKLPPEEQVKYYEAKLARLEKQHADMEREKDDVNSEMERMRDLLYAKEGHKTVQHIMDLEKDNRRLRHELSKAKDQAIYHQSAHMTTMDDLVKLKQNIDTQGSYTQLKADYDLLRYEVNRLVYANTDLSLRLAESQDQLAAMATGDQKSSSRGAGPGSMFLSGSAGKVMLNGTDSGVHGSSPFKTPSLDDIARSKQITSMNPGQSKPLFGTAASPKKSSDEAGEADNSDNKVPSASSILERHSRGQLGTENALGGQDLGQGWRALTLENGQVVYHNAFTNKSQWEIPPEVIKGNSAAAAPGGVGSAFASNQGSTMPLGLL